MKQNRIKLTEAQLRDMISESVKKALNEGDYDDPRILSEEESFKHTLESLHRNLPDFSYYLDYTPVSEGYTDPYFLYYLNKIDDAISTIAWITSSNYMDALKFD